MKKSIQPLGASKPPDANKLSHKSVTASKPQLAFPVFDYLFFRRSDWGLLSRLGLLDGEWIDLGITDYDLRTRVLPFFDVTYSIHNKARVSTDLKKMFPQYQEFNSLYGLMPANKGHIDQDHLWASYESGVERTLWPQMLYVLGIHVDREIYREMLRMRAEVNDGFITDQERKLRELSLLRTGGWLVENGLEGEVNTYLDLRLTRFCHALSIATLLGFDPRGLYTYALFPEDDPKQRRFLERIISNKLCIPTSAQGRLIEGDFVKNLDIVRDLSAAWACALQAARDPMVRVIRD